MKTKWIVMMWIGDVCDHPPSVAVFDLQQDAVAMAKQYAFTGKAIVREVVYHDRADHATRPQ